MKIFSQRLASGALIVGLSLGLAGCGDSSDADKNPAGDKPTVAATPQPTLTTATPTAKATSEKTPGKANPKAPPKLKTNATGTTLPKDFPKHLPLPKATLATATTTPQGWMLEYQGVNADSFGQLKKQIVAAGGTESYSSESSEFEHAMFEMTNYTLQLLRFPKAKGNETALAYTINLKED